MPNINPDLQGTNDPNYLNYSKPIPPFEGDKSVGMLLTGIGKTIENVTTVADQIIKEQIDKQVRERSGPIVEEQTRMLEDALGVPLEQRVTTPGISYDTGPNITQAEGGTPADQPTSIQATGRTTQGIGKALALKPRLQTYYLGQLDTLNKDLVTQHPGYADYVRARTAAATGVREPNAYLNNLTSILAAQQTEGKDQVNKALSLIATNAGWPGDKDLAIKISHGLSQDPVADVIAWISPWKSIENRLALQKKFNETEKSNYELKAQSNEQTAIDVANGAANQIFSQGLSNLGLTPQKLQELADGYFSGKATMSDQDGEKYGLMMKQAAAQARTYIENLLDQKDETGRSISSYIQGKRKNIVDDAVAKFDRLGDMFLNHEYGPAFGTARWLVTSQNQLSKWLLTESKDKDFYAYAVGAAKAGGPAVQGILASEAVGRHLTHVGDDIKAYSKFRTLQSMSSPDGKLQMILDDLHNKGVGTDPAKPSQREVYNYFTSDLPDYIADTKYGAPLRAQLAENVFDGNIVDKFAPDTRNAQGKVIPGQHSVLTNMTKDNIRDAVWDLSGKGTGDLWLKYKNWVTVQTNSTLNRDVHDIDSIASNPNVKFTWNTNSHKLDVVFADQFNQFPGKGGVMAAELKQNYKDTVEHINQSLRPLIGIASKEGNDPNAFVIQQLVNLGLKTDSLSNSSQIMKTITGPSPFDKKAENFNPEAPQKVSLNFAAESPTSQRTPIQLGTGEATNVQQSLKEWISNPTNAKYASEIKGRANVASPGPIWGNPFNRREFESQHLEMIHTPSGKQIAVNKASAEAFRGFLADLEATGYKINQLSGYVPRMMRDNPNVVSQHAYGNAIDINEAKNPKGPRLKTDMPKFVSQLAAKWGLSWGGDWRSSKDAMHFEYTGKEPPTSVANQ